VERICAGPQDGILLLEQLEGSVEGRPYNYELSSLSPEGVRRSLGFVNIAKGPEAMDYDPYLNGVWISSARGEVLFGKLTSGELRCAFLTPNAAVVSFLAVVGPGKAVVRDNTDRFWIISALAGPAQELAVSAKGLRYPSWSAKNKMLCCPSVALVQGSEAVLCSSVDGVLRIRRLIPVENGFNLYGVLTDNHKFFCEGRDDSGIIVHDLRTGAVRILDSDSEIEGMIAAGDSKVLIEGSGVLECYDVEESTCLFRIRWNRLGRAVSREFGPEKYLVFRDGIGCYIADMSGVTLVSDRDR